MIVKWKEKVGSKWKAENFSHPYSLQIANLDQQATMLALCNSYFANQGRHMSKKEWVWNANIIHPTNILEISGEKSVWSLVWIIMIIIEEQKYCEGIKCSLRIHFYFVIYIPFKNRQTIKNESEVSKEFIWTSNFIHNR